MTITAAIIVTYNPDAKKLAALVRQTTRQFDFTILVDNHSIQQEALPEPAQERLCVVYNATNTGIAGAQNTGIHIALERGAQHLAFFDQDSCIAPDYLEKMLATERELLNQQVPLAALGPRIIDQATGISIPFFQQKKWRKVAVTLHESGQTTECFALLSSGTLMRAEALQAVGLYREDFFIDYVDVEWGARARAKGLVSYGTSCTDLIHNLGDSRVRIFSRLLPLHSPQRHYYTYRNAVQMQKLGFVPLAWKVNDLLRSVRNLLLYLALSPHRIQRLRYICTGIWHGLTNRMGPL